MLVINLDYTYQFKIALVYVLVFGISRFHPEHAVQIARIQISYGALILPLNSAKD